MEDKVFMKYTLLIVIVVAVVGFFTVSGSGAVTGDVVRSDVSEFGVDVNSCRDTDGGRNASVKGTISGTDSQFVFSLSDACVNSGSLREYFCMQTPPSPGVKGITKAASVITPCIAPATCQNGACAAKPQRSCVDTDGMDYALLGQVTYFNETLGRLDVVSDRCERNINELLEAYCDGTSRKGQYHTCPNGCANGACAAPQPFCRVEGDNVVTEQGTFRTHCENNVKEFFSCSSGQKRSVIQNCNTRGEECNSQGTDCCWTSSVPVSLTCEGNTLINVSRGACSGTEKTQRTECPAGCSAGKCCSSGDVVRTFECQGTNLINITRNNCNRQEDRSSTDCLTQTIQTVWADLGNGWQLHQTNTCDSQVGCTVCGGRKCKQGNYIILRTACMAGEEDLGIVQC